MTIQVDLKHGDTGHPAPFYVTPIDPSTGKLGYSYPVRDRDTLTQYIHDGKALLITERPPTGALGMAVQMSQG